jgi:hypothetical protein
MPPFAERPALEALLPHEHEGPGAQLYQLLRDFTYESTLLGSITVPKGLVTDFASIPRLARAYLDDDDPRILCPAIVHDWLYTKAGHLFGKPAYTRQQADLVLREAMLACGARPTMAWVVYRSVRLFGGGHWKA